MFRSELLNALLERELALGNHVTDDGPGWGAITRLILLQYPFRSLTSEWGHGLELREVNDPHYWKAEIEDTATREMLACRVG